ncbi:MAG: acyl-CoA dehydrogenase family protein, partial [Chloroflexota bacterium]
DLASIRSTADKVAGGWRLNGRKVWTSWAHRFHYMVTLVRTAPPSDNRHAGMSQLLIDLSAEGVSTQPIISIDGEHHFNEVIFDNLFVPDEMVVGEIGQGWQQVIGELAYERSGPERFLSTLPVLTAFLRRMDQPPIQQIR